MNDRSSPVAARSADGALKRDFENVVEAVETLLRTTAGETSAEWRRAREALEGRVEVLRSKLSDHAGDLTAQARELGDRGGQIVRSHPWASIGAGAGLGLLAGLLIRRR